MTAEPASRHAKRASLREWETLIKRYPLTSPWLLAWQAATVLGGNIVVAWLIVTARMSPFELVLLVAAECVLLIAIAWLQGRFVPKEALQKSEQTVGQRLFVLAFGLFWLGAVYGLVLGGFVPQGDQVRRLLADPQAFLLASTIKWPLLITLAGALVDALQDHAHFGRHGGLFVSTPGFQAGARLLTLFLGGIPFFMPLVAVVGTLVVVLKKAGEWLRARRGHDAQNLWMVAATPLLGLAFFGVFAVLVTSDVSGWAIGYATAKLAAELFVVALPLIAKMAHAEESAALDSPPKPGRKTR